MCLAQIYILVLYNRLNIGLRGPMGQGSDQATNWVGDNEQITSTSLFYLGKGRRNLNKDLKALFQV